MIKSKIRLTLSVLLLLTLAITCVLGLTGCGDKVEQIYINKTNSPRLSYVQGQELDLSTGLLTAVIDGEESMIPLSAEGVSISGYNKDTLGPQTVTVTYEEQTTTFSVTVIPRMSAEGYERGYFIGDKFKADKGKLKIARDDATTFMVNMSDPSVSLVSFDSASAGEAAVTVNYNGNGMDYDCTFTVTVYEASDITPVFPKKKEYGNHETELDFTGGYLTIRAKGNNSLEKRVEISAETMTVTGYDPTAVTKEANRETPITQTISISYLGQTFTYKIRLIYSGISVIRDQMDTLNEVDFTVTNPSLNEEQRAAAIEAISEYYKLQNKDRALIGESDLHTIVRCAAASVQAAYFTELNNYQETFYIGQNGVLQTPATSYEQTKIDVAKLKDEEELLNVYTEILRDLSKDFADVEIVAGLPVSRYIVVLPKEMQDELIVMFEHAIKVYDVIENAQIPKNWTDADLIAKKDAIALATSLIVKETFHESGRSIYRSVSKWREGNDYFEILYHYYLIADPTEANAAYVEETMLNNVPWPKIADAWYGAFYAANYIASVLKSAPNDYSLTDLSDFFYNYSAHIQMGAEIRANKDTDKLSYALYSLTGGSAYEINLRNRPYGYYQLAGVASAESDTYTAAFQSYLALYDLFKAGAFTAEDGSFTAGEHGGKFEAMIDSLTALSPEELFAFLSSLNFKYSTSDGTFYALADNNSEGKYLNKMSLFLYTYYDTVLDDAEYALFDALLTAMETYARSALGTAKLDAFKSTMQALVTDYTALADKSTFNLYFGDAYAKYVAIYNELMATEKTALDASNEARLQHMVSIVKQIASITSYIVSHSGEDAPEMMEGAYFILFSLYEEARIDYNALRAQGKTDANIALVLATRTFEVAGKVYTADQLFYSAGSTFWSFMIIMAPIGIQNPNGTTTSYSFYDFYIMNLEGFALEGNPDDPSDDYFFLEDAAQFLYAVYANDFSAITADYVQSLLESYAQLKPVARQLFRLLGGENLLLNGAKTYFAAKLEGDAPAIAIGNQLIEVIKAYVAYDADDDNAEKLAAFKSAMEVARTAYTNLTDATGFDAYLKDLYDFLNSNYEKVNA